MKTRVKPDPQILRLALIVKDLGNTAYLVGGHLRDLIMKRTSKDADFAIDGDTVAAARRVAAETGGHWFPLDKERGTMRVIYLGGGVLETVDFTRLQGGSIEDDLGRRDFTIDAMAWESSLEDVVIDPFGGLDDIKARRIRAVSDTSLADDPVRLIRAFRLAVVLGFKIADDTIAMIKRDAGLIGPKPGERIRNELVGILREDDSAPTLRKMRDTGLLTHVFPELSDVEALRELESSMKDKDRYSEELESGISLMTVLKIAALLGDFDKKTAITAADRIRLSKKSKRALVRAKEYLDIL